MQPEDGAVEGGHEDEEYDALNDETFGSAAVVDGDWEESHQHLASITEANRHSSKLQVRWQSVLVQRNASHHCMHCTAFMFSVHYEHLLRRGGYKLGQTNNCFCYRSLLFFSWCRSFQILLFTVKIYKFCVGLQVNTAMLMLQ